MMAQWKRQAACGLAAMCMVMLLCFTPAQGVAQGERTLRVAFPSVQGYSVFSTDGTPSGVVVDFLREIAKYTGWTYEFIPVPESEFMERFAAGEFDLASGQYKTDENESLFGFPKYSCGTGRMLLLARKGDSRIKSYDRTSLNGKTIGVYDSYSEIVRRLGLFLDAYRLGCEVVVYPYDASDPSALVDHLAHGDVDVMLGNTNNLNDSVVMIDSFRTAQHYIVTRPEDTQLLGELSDALERIYEADPQFAERAYDAHFQQLDAAPAITLNESERAYIEAKGSLVIAAPKEWHPLFCLGVSDKHHGIAYDVAVDVTAFSGLAITWLQCDTYMEAVEAVGDGRADVLAFFLGTDDVAAEQGLALTYPYGALSYLLVRNKNVLEPSADMRIATLRGDNDLPDNLAGYETVDYEIAADALTDVNAGRVDLFYGIAAQVEKCVQENVFTNLIQTANSYDERSFSFAVRRSDDPALLSILNKAINSLPEEELSAIGARNMVAVGQTQLTLEKLIYADPLLFIGLTVLIALVGIGALLFVFKAHMRSVKMKSELAQAEASNRAKTEFLSRMSHEMRTPLNAIVGLTEIAERRSGLPKEAQGDLVRIKASSDYLLGMINDVLDMERIESDQLELHAEPFSMGALLDDMESLMRGVAEQKGLHFHVKRAFSQDVLLGDEYRLRQVLLNLLTNAIKFTEKGGLVRLSVVEKGQTKDAVTFTFRVLDTGCGIAEEDSERIFQSFVQVGADLSKSQGTGLGLSIGRYLVEQMGGKLEMVSDLGKGSDFHFTLTLPKTNLPLPERKSVPKGALGGVKVLLAEDNELNAEIAITLLSEQGAEVVHAANGRQAVSLFEKSPENHFNAILMDVMMPEMDGMEATRAIRALLREDAQRVPIFALTANAFQKDKEEALLAGMTDFVSKPFDVRVLVDKLSNASNGR